VGLRASCCVADGFGGAKRPAVALHLANVLLARNIDAGQHGKLASQADRLKADPLPMLSDLLRIEASEPPTLQPLNHPADHRGLSASRLASQQQVFWKAIHCNGFQSTARASLAR
jgi:hypothetical protein